MKKLPSGPKWKNVHVENLREIANEIGSGNGFTPEAIPPTIKDLLDAADYIESLKAAEQPRDTATDPGCVCGHWWNDHQWETNGVRLQHQCQHCSCCNYREREQAEGDK